MPMQRIRTFSLTAIAVAMAATAAEAAPPHGYNFTVVETLDGSKYFGDFEPQDINSRGDVLFASDVTDNGTSAAGEALYGRYNGTTRVIARAGASIEGTIGLKYGSYPAGGIYTPAGMNDSGDVAFGFAIDGENFGGVFRYDRTHNEVSPVLLPGDAAPGGTHFQGTDFHTDLNNRGEIATTGVIETLNGHCNVQTLCNGYGRGIYTFNRFNHATKIAAPGDKAPGSTSTFDDAWDPNLNNSGDVIFGGHVTGEVCIGAHLLSIGCFENLYLYQASTRDLRSVAHQGDAAPGGGKFNYAFNGRLNARGDASFIGQLADDKDPPAKDPRGVFLRQRDGTLLAVARPDDTLPGGKTMNTTSYSPGSHAIDDAGNVAFSAVLNNDTNGDGIPDTGVYFWSAGTIVTVVETGTVIPGLGTVAHVNNYYNVQGEPYNANPGVHMNARGQILTQVVVKAGGVDANYVVLATPK